MRGTINSSLWPCLVLVLVGLSCNQPSPQGPVEVISSTDTAEEPVSESTFDLDNFQRLVDTYEDPSRQEWQNPGLIMDRLGDLDQKTIADIGAGTGYFTFRLAAQGATVIAIDIDERFLEYIEQRRAELYRQDTGENIFTRLSLADDPLLDTSEIDHALLVNTYYFLVSPVEYLTKVYDALKEEGSLIIVDYNTENIPVGPAEEFKVDPGKIKAELEQAGFTSITLDTSSLKYQYLITAKK